MLKAFKNLILRNKRVLVRCDLNVPLSKEGEIIDGFRIKRILPTIEYLLRENCKIILISHLGRPGGRRNERYSLRPVAARMEKMLGRKVNFLSDCIGKDVEDKIDGMKYQDICLLENLRFHAGEKANDTDFARALSKLAEVYVNDAFGVCHRMHASIAELPKYLPSGAGLLLEKEVDVLEGILKNPKRPLVVIIGGIKILTKIGVIERFLKIADHLLLGGKICEPVLQIKDILIGRPWPDEKVIEPIRKINLTDTKLHLPVDGLVCLPEAEEGYSRTTAIGSVRKEEDIFDIGPETIKLFSSLVGEAKTILWSGPLGRFEQEPFDRGSNAVARAIIKNHSAFKIVGGGDTNAFLGKYGLRDKFDHVSTGGGAMLEFLSGKELPGIKALQK